MKVLLIAAVIVAAWYLYSRSQVRDYGAKPGLNELEQLNPTAAPAGGDTNYSPDTGRTSSELDAVDPATDPGNLADYQPDGQWVGGADFNRDGTPAGTWTPVFIENLLASARPN